MRAIKLPLQSVDGRVLMTGEYTDIVRQNIVAAIITYQDERVYRPEFGLEDPVFQAVDRVPVTLGLIKSAIALTLTEDFPEVTYSVLGSINEDGKLDIVVQYSTPDSDPYTVEITV